MAQAATASSGPPPLSPPSSSGGKEEAPCGGSRIEVIRQLLPYIELPLAATTAPQCHVVDHVINDTSPLGPPPATTPASGRGGGKGDKGEMAHLDSLHQHSREHALLGKHPELPEDSGSGGGAAGRRALVVGRLPSRITPPRTLEPTPCLSLSDQPPPPRAKSVPRCPSGARARPPRGRFRRSSSTRAGSTGARRSTRP